ncbi:MAG: ABC transporter permease [Planctomycetota bacterium]
MKKIKDILKAAFHKIAWWLPEVLLLICGLALLPLLYYLGDVAVNMARAGLDNPSFFAGVIRANAWTSVAWVICFLGVAGAGWCILRGRSNVWAVARKMIVEALHRRVVVGLLIFFVIMMPSIRFIVQTEGSLKSQIQIVLTYSLTLAEVLLSIIVVFLCTASICSEIEDKHVFVTDVKPMQRWEFLVGKLLGVLVLSGALLFLMSGAVYALTTRMGRDRSFDALPEWEAREKREELRRAHNEVLVSRIARTPLIPDVSEGVEKEIERLREAGELERPAAERDEIRERMIKQRFTARSGGALMLTIPGLRRQEDIPVFLRFKPVTTDPDGPEQVQGTWMFYRAAEEQPEDGEEDGEEDERQMEPVYRHGGNWVTGSYQEVEVPPGVISPQGLVHVAFWNFHPEAGVQFDPDGGVEIMQEVGGFFANYYRSVLVILCHIVVLAALALMAGAALSFPVASFTVGAVILVGLLGPWVAGTALEGSSIPADAAGGAVVIGYLKMIVNTVLRGVLFILPQFGRYSPLSDLVNGRMVSWGFVGRAAAVLCFVKGGIAMLLGTYFYWKRELARIIA